jgi:hypothetical protein
MTPCLVPALSIRSSYSSLSPHKGLGLVHPGWLLQEDGSDRISIGVMTRSAEMTTLLRHIHLHRPTLLLASTALLLLLIIIIEKNRGGARGNRCDIWVIDARKGGCYGED